MKREFLMTSGRIRSEDRYPYLKLGELPRGYQSLQGSTNTPRAVTA